MMMWKRQPPDSVGWWLRISLGGSPQAYYVNDLRPNGELVTCWGNNEQAKNLPVTHEKMKNWLWMKIPDWGNEGPLPGMERNTR